VEFGDASTQKEEIEMVKKATRMFKHFIVFVLIITMVTQHITLAADLFQDEFNVQQYNDLPAIEPYFIDPLWTEDIYYSMLEEEFLHVIADDDDFDQALVDDIQHREADCSFV